MKYIALIALALAAGCARKKDAAQAGRAADAAVGPVIAPAEPLPEGVTKHPADAYADETPARGAPATDGTIGAAVPVRFVAAADDGSWVMMCENVPGARPRLRVVVGDGPGVTVDRAIAVSDRDLLLIDGDVLVHVDAVARTRRPLGPAALGTVDGASRRIVHADGTDLIVRDPGLPPRKVPAGVAMAAMWSQSKRWMHVAPGERSSELAQGACGLVHWWPQHYRADERVTIDLDPSGVEAADRVGPELGITPAGEVTLDGAVVVGPECVGLVAAALADPPRALVLCGTGRNRVVGPGFNKEVSGYQSPPPSASISDQLILGQQLVCLSGACVDLISGRDYDTNGNEHVWSNERTLVRKRGSGLVIDALDEVRQRDVPLPKVTQAVTVDTATGRRRAGPAPLTPSFVDGAGAFLLYGRYVIDTDAAQVVATLPADALAIDRTGRVLLEAAPGIGPLRWRRP